MNKTIKMLTAALLVMAMILTAIPALAGGKDNPTNAVPAEVSGDTFYNDYISLQVNARGRVLNYRNAANQALLYPSSYNGTSKTTIRINGSNNLYGDPSTLTVPASFIGDVNYSAYDYNGVYVEQRLTPVANDTGNVSIVEWRYTFTNNTSASQSVGCRIMLDTCLGSTAGDGAPYRIPGVDSITTEQTYTGSSIPAYWFTFYQDIVAQGSFASDNIPDMFQIAQWTRITDWNYSTSSNYTMSDTCAAAQWNEAALQPGESREYVMYYGIGEVAQQQVGQLQLTLNGNHSVALNDAQDGYEPNPVSLMGILANVGNAGLTGVYANVVLPEGLSLVGDNGQFNVGALAAGAEDQETWYISIDSTSTEDRTFVIEVHYGCDGQEEAVAYWNLFVPGVPAAEPTLPPVVNAVRAELRNRQPNDTRVDVRFIFNVTFNDSFINYRGVNYGPAADYQITGYRTVLTTMGSSAVVPGTTIFEMNEGSFTFTAVVKNMRPVNYDKYITAVAYMDYVEAATGIAGADNTADEPITVCVNDLLG